MEPTHEADRIYISFTGRKYVWKFLYSAYSLLVNGRVIVMFQKPTMIIGDDLARELENKDG